MSGTSSLQNLINNMPRDQRSHESCRSRDALSVSHALVKDTQRGSTLSKHINVKPRKQQKPPKNIQPSNHPIKMGHVTPVGGTPAREQPVHRDGRPTLGGGTPTSAGTSIPGGTSTQKLTYEEVTKITEKVLKKNPESVRKYARGEKKVLTLCYLAGMVLNACYYKADPQMVDDVLLERLQNVNIIETKGSMLQHRI